MILVMSGLCCCVSYDVNFSGTECCSEFVVDLLSNSLMSVPFGKADPV